MSLSIPEDTESEMQKMIREISENLSEVVCDNFAKGQHWRRARHSVRFRLPTHISAKISFQKSEVVPAHGLWGWGRERDGEHFEGGYIIAVPFKVTPQPDGTFLATD